MKSQRLYWVWQAMMQRCRNPNSPQFKDYGGRGITVCAEWQDFATFSSDMGDPCGRTLDRIDNAKGYSAENCRWASRKEQNSNRRNCIYTEIDGARMTLFDACKKKGLPYDTIRARITGLGWPIEFALTAPIGIHNQFARTRKANQ